MGAIKLTIYAIVFLFAVGNCYSQGLRGCITANAMSEKPQRGNGRYSTIDSISISNIYAIISTDKSKIFVLDTVNMFINCFDSKGKKVWKTNPRKNAEMKNPGYAPCISSFWLEKFYVNKTKKNIGDIREFLWVCYSDQEFGFLNQETGAFIYCGRLD